MIDFNQILTNFEGTELRSSEDEPLRLGDVAVAALLLPEDKADGAQKLARFKLAQKIRGADGYNTVELNSKKKALILDLVAQGFATLIYGRAYEAIEGIEEDAE